MSGTAYNDIKNPLVIKTLYISLVRSVMTYGSVIWRPHYNNAMNKFEKIHHKAFRKIAFLQGCPIDRFSHDYSSIAKKLEIPSVESFFDYLELSFMYKIFSENRIQSFTSLFTLKQNVYPLRSARIVSNPKNMPNYMARNPITRLTISFNNLCNNRPAFSNFEF